MSDLEKVYGIDFDEDMQEYIVFLPFSGKIFNEIFSDANEAVCITFAESQGLVRIGK